MISYHSESQRYELILPQEIASIFTEHAADSSTPIKLVHSDKDKLEGLLNAIKKEYATDQENLRLRKKRDAIYRYVCLFTLFILLPMVVLFSNDISKLLGLRIWALGIIGSFVGVYFSLAFVSDYNGVPLLPIPFTGRAALERQEKENLIKISLLYQKIQKDFQ